MERTELFDLMGELKLYGMKAAFDEVMATAVKRQHEPQRVVGDLLKAEISEKQARSIKYQLTIAKLPLAKDLADFQFEGTPINQTLVNDLAGGAFFVQQRNVVLVGGTGTGKTHLAIAITRSCIRSGARGRFYNVVDLVNRLETENRNGRQGRLADHLTRMDFVILDELGYLPFAQSGGQLLFHLVSQTLRTHLHHRHHQSGLRRMAKRVRRCQDDHRTARSTDPPLRYRRDRQRELALQKPSRRSRDHPRSRRLRNPDQLRRRERYHQNTSLKGVLFGRRSGVPFQRRLTVRTLPSFREAYRKRRCILPVDGFFEWKAIKGQKAKQPHAIAMKDGRPFGVGGLWENSRDPTSGEWMRTFAIIHNGRQ